MIGQTRRRIHEAIRAGKHGHMLFIVMMLACPWAILYARQKAPDQATTDSNYHYDVQHVRLEGMLTERKVYGPPGYGETPAQDERTTILILKLAHAITVEPLADAKAKDSPNLDTARNIREVQLFVGRSQIAEARKLLSKNVVAVGTLNEAVAPSQYTRVWLDTKTLSLKPTSTTP
jgi:hypothetical protein